MCGSVTMKRPNQVPPRARNQCTTNPSKAPMKRPPAPRGGAISRHWPSARVMSSEELQRAPEPFSETVSTPGRSGVTSRLCRIETLASRRTPLPEIPCLVHRRERLSHHPAGTLAPTVPPPDRAREATHVLGVREGGCGVHPGCASRDLHGRRAGRSTLRALFSWRLDAESVPRGNPGLRGCLFLGCAKRICEAERRFSGGGAWAARL